VTASDGKPGDLFGFAAAVDADVGTIVVVAFRVDSNLDSSGILCFLEVR